MAAVLESASGRAVFESAVGAVPRCQGVAAVRGSPDQRVGIGVGEGVKYGVVRWVSFACRVRPMGNVVWGYLFGLEQEDSAVFGMDDKQIPIYSKPLEIRKKLHIALFLLHYAGRVRA